MEYAFQLLFLILGGLLLGLWLHNQYGFTALGVILFPILGFILGLLMMYKNSVLYSSKSPPKSSSLDARPTPLSSSKKSDRHDNTSS